MKQNLNFGQEIFVQVEPRYVRTVPIACDFSDEYHDRYAACWVGDGSLVRGRACLPRLTID